MNLQPLGDRLIVEVLEEEEITAALCCRTRRGEAAARQGRGRGPGSA